MNTLTDNSAVDILPSPYCEVGTPNPDDLLTDEELDLRDDLEDYEASLRRQEAGLAASLAEGTKHKARVATAIQRSRIADDVLSGNLGAVAVHMGLPSPFPLRKAAPPPANDNKRGRVVFMGEAAPYKPQPELVRDTIPRNGVGFFGGQSGAWKTFFSLHAGTCFMTGEPLAGRNIERIGGVVYLAAEGAGTIEGRMAARRKRLANPSEILPFYRVDGLGAIIDARGYSALEQRCAEAAEDCRERFDLPLVALFIDTVAAAGMIAEDKENDPGAWQKVFDGLQPIATRLDIVIILIHHAGKNAAAGLRGSSNARAGADFALMLSCDRDELTGKSANHFLSLSKSRDAPEGPIASIRAEPVVIGYRDDQSPVTSLTLDFGLGEAPAAKGKKPTRAEQDFMSALGRTELDRVRVRGESDAPLVQAAKLADVRCEFDAVYVTAEADGAKAKDARRNQFKRGLAAAVKRRAVHTGTWADTEWVWFAEADSDSDGLNRTQSE